MKALSLTQPWASLVATGRKRVETRSWTTSYRGRIAIHASKRYPSEARVFSARLDREGVSMGELPLGAIVAYANLVAIVTTAEALDRIDEGERAVGNFAPGRFAWFLEDVEALAEPIPARGSLGLWEWTR